MAKRKITVEGFFDKIRKHLQKNLDDRLAKELDDILDNPSKDVRKAAVQASKATIELNKAIERYKKSQK